MKTTAHRSKAGELHVESIFGTSKSVLQTVVPKIRIILLSSGRKQTLGTDLEYFFRFFFCHCKCVDCCYFRTIGHVLNSGVCVMTDAMPGHPVPPDHDGQHQWQGDGTGLRPGPEQTPAAQHQVQQSLQQGAGMQVIDSHSDTYVAIFTNTRALLATMLLPSLSRTHTRTCMHLCLRSVCTVFIF